MPSSPSETFGVDDKSVRQLARSSWRRAHRALCQMQTVPHIVTYNGVAESCGRGRRWDISLELLRQMGHHGVRPDAIMFMTLLVCCRIASEWRQGLALLNFMEDENPPNEKHWSVVISACEGHWVQAVSLLSAACSFRMASVFAFSSCITACEKGKEWERALSLLGEMSIRRFTPDVVARNATMSACEKGMQWRMALFLLQDMRHIKLVPTIVSYGAVISACEKRREWENAIVLFEEMKQYSCGVDAVVVNATISACESGGQWARATALLMSMSHFQLRPRVEGYNAALAACAQAKEWERALILLSQMVQGVCAARPSVVSWNSIVAALDTQWSVGLALLRHMSSLHVDADVETLRAASSLCEGTRMEFASIRQLATLLYRLPVQPSERHASAWAELSKARRSLPAALSNLFDRTVDRRFWRPAVRELLRCEPARSAGRWRSAALEDAQGLDSHFVRRTLEYCALGDAGP